MYIDSVRHRHKREPNKTAKLLWRFPKWNVYDLENINALINQ